MADRDGSMLLVVYICVCCFKDAEPTEPEKSAHDQVAGVLKKAGEIEERLRCYQGAGEPIRQVQQLVR